MKSIIAIIATAFAVTAFAAEPAKVEATAKPAAVAAPATPKEMPKVANQLRKKRPTLLKVPSLQHLPRTKRQQLHLLQQHPQLQQPSQQLSNLSLDEDDEDYDDVNCDLHVAYRRPVLVHEDNAFEQDDEELSDYVKTRLLIARTFALAKIKRA